MARRQTELTRKDIAEALEGAQGYICHTCNTFGRGEAPATCRDQDHTLEVVYADEWFPAHPS